MDLAQAEQLLEQFLETSRYRGWIVHAVSIMANHVHWVVEAPSEVGKKKLLGDFKATAAGDSISSPVAARRKPGGPTAGPAGRCGTWQPPFSTCAIASPIRWSFGRASADAFRPPNRTPAIDFLERVKSMSSWQVSRRASLPRASLPRERGE